MRWISWLCTLNCNYLLDHPPLFVKLESCGLFQLAFLVFGDIFPRRKLRKHYNLVCLCDVEVISPSTLTFATSIWVQVMPPSRPWLGITCVQLVFDFAYI